MRLDQRIYIVRRKSDGAYLHCGGQIWTDKVSEAYLVSRIKFKSLIRVTLGRNLEDYERVEVVPTLKETSDGLTSQS